jgi:excisionase family DNA binding protein
MNKNFTIKSIALATGFSVPWTQRMLANRQRHLTVAQVAERLQVTKVYVYKMINKGRVSAHKFNGRMCITFRNLASWRMSVA